MDSSKALSIVESWESELESHRAALVAAASAGGASVDAPVCDEVILSDKSYTAEAARIIADFMNRPGPGGAPSVASGVTRLDASDMIASRMEDEGLEVLTTLCDAFRRSGLREVNLSDNAMGSKGVSACRSVLGRQRGTLECLRLCNNGLSSESMGEVADILTGDAKDEYENDDKDNDNSTTICSRLRIIHFYNNMSGDGGCRAFARILSGCTSALTDIRFSGTRAGREGSLLVASALDSLGESVRNLTKLDLADNSFGPEGGRLLFRSLSRCRNLSHLDLRDCVLEDGGLKQICHALWSADLPVVHLDVSGNEITAKGAGALGDFVKEAVSLRVLCAEENEMTSRGIAALARSLGRGGERVWSRCSWGAMSAAPSGRERCWRPTAVRRECPT